MFKLTHLLVHRRFFAAVIGIAILPAGWAHEVVIQNVTLLTANRSQPAPNQNVRIRDDRIVEISSRALQVGAGVERIDGRGKFLTPGIMDSHVHVGELPGVPIGSKDPAHATLHASFAIQQPRSYLYFGVTQLLDLTGPAEATVTFNAQPIRPDLFYCGLAPPLDGYPTVFVPKSERYSLMPNFIYEPANADKHPLPQGFKAQDHTPEAVVNRIALSGARCIKVPIEEGFGGARDWPILSTETLQRVRKAATERGLLLIAHANALGTQRIAVNTRVDVIAHGLWNWDLESDKPGVPPHIAAHLRSVHEHKIGYQPTIRVLAGMADLFRDDTLKDPAYLKVVPPALLRWYSTEEGQWFKNQLRKDFDAPDMQIAHIHLKTAAQGMRAAKFLHDLGHPLLLGSDTPSAPTYGNQPGYDTYREMRFMAQSGIPLDAIFRAATINNAQQFGLDQDYGTIEPGKIANLLLLDANPLQTVRAWSLIDKVVLRGKVIEREMLAADRSDDANTD